MDVSGRDLRLEPLAESHRPLRAGFSSGSEQLDTYMKTQARKDMQNGTSFVWILHDRSNDLIAGYYTLNTYTVTLESLDPSISKRLGRYPLIPTILLGRLAVDLRYQGRRLGAALLFDAMRRAYDTSKSIGSIGLVVHAKDENARRFYEKYGFVRLADDELHLIIGMRAIAPLIELHHSTGGIPGKP
jgi:GNAT superfamily N-acetyltransferase